MNARLVSCLSGLAGTLALAGTAWAGPIYDSINSPLGGGTNAQLGFLWKLPDPAPNKQASNQYDRVELLPDKSAPSKPIIYSGLNNQNGKPSFSAPAQAQLNATEQKLLSMGTNVLKVRAVTTQQLQDVIDYRVNFTNTTGSRTPELLKTMREQKGLIAFPDDTVMKAATRLRDYKKAGQTRLPDNPQGQADVQVLTDYFKVNQEAFLIRAQTLDPERSKSLEALRGRIGELNNYDPVNDPQTKKLAIDVRVTWGLQRTPTRDEVRGLSYWTSYFTGREDPNREVKLGGQLWRGERTVAGYLDTKEVRYAADLLRYNGTNPMPRPLTQAEIDQGRKNNFVEQLNDPVHDWRDVAASVLESRRDELDQRRDTDRKGAGERGK